MNRRQFLFAGAAAALTPLVRFAPAPAPAFAEGSSLPKPPPAMVPLYGDQRIQIGYANAVKGYEHVYPLLAAAVVNIKPALTPTIEWIRVNRKGHLYAERNYTQILRTPFGLTGTQVGSHGDFESQMRKLRKDALHSHLADVEQTLKHGKRGGRPLGRTCGGVECFGAGEPALRPLRDLTLMKNRQAMDADQYIEEYLGEFSLQVG